MSTYAPQASSSSQSLTPHYKIRRSVKSLRQTNIIFMQLIRSNFQRPAPIRFVSPTSCVMSGGAAQQQQQQQSSNINKDHNSHVNKIFIGGLSPDTNKDDIQEYFAKYGEILDAVVMTDPVNNRSRGFGFVKFASIDQVDKVQADRDHIIKGKQVETKRATPKGQAIDPTSSQAKKVFVGGVPADCTKEDLRQYAEEHFGPTEDVYLNAQNARHYAFITFVDYDHADKMILQGEHQFKNHTLIVNRAQLKSARQGQMPMRNGGPGQYGGGGPGGYRQQNFNNSYNSGGGGYGGSPYQNFRNHQQFQGSPYAYQQQQQQHGSPYTNGPPQQHMMPQHQSGAPMYGQQSPMLPHNSFNRSNNSSNAPSSPYAPQQGGANASNSMNYPPQQQQHHQSYSGGYGSNSAAGSGASSQGYQGAARSGGSLPNSGNSNMQKSPSGMGGPSCNEQMPPQHPYGGANKPPQQQQYQKSAYYSQNASSNTGGANQSFGSNTSHNSQGYMPMGYGGNANPSLKQHE
ncbi:MAG: heteroproteinous nuclear ribonucleoprotein [Marteilia pararefringens]